MNGNFGMNDNYASGFLTAGALTSTAWAPLIEKLNSFGSALLTILGIVLMGMRIYHEWRNNKSG